MAGVCHWLPDEAWIEIICPGLDVRSLVRLSGTCHLFHQLAHLSTNSTTCTPASKLEFQNLTTDGHDIVMSADRQADPRNADHKQWETMRSVVEYWPRLCLDVAFIRGFPFSTNTEIPDLLHSFITQTHSLEIENCSLDH